MSQYALPMANAACGNNCKEDHHWIFKGAPAGLECYEYIGEHAHVGRVDGGAGTKTAGPGTNGRKRCPIGFCNEVCTAVEEVWTEANHSGLVDYFQECVTDAPVTTYFCDL